MVRMEPGLWLTPAIPALRRWRPKYQKFEAILSCIANLRKFGLHETKKKKRKKKGRKRRRRRRRMGWKDGSLVKSTALLPAPVYNNSSRGSKALL